MESAIPERAWLLMAAGDGRGYGGNAGYDDQFDAYYSWDSKVPNHTKLQVGDPVAIWDKERLLGISVIEEIEKAPGTKLLSRCPSCGATQISPRQNMRPRFRCTKCKAEFDVARPEAVEVTEYRARYDAAWTPLEGMLSDAEVRALQANRGEFNAMRALDWVAFRDTLIRKSGERAVSRVPARLLDIDWRASSDLGAKLSGGFRRALVRVRRGQGGFRRHLLETQGTLCAFTGGAPERVLEAGHLYSYARLGEHHPHGGLMLRRDIHRLFDDGLLAVDPGALRIDVAPELARFEQYARLHDRPLRLRLEGEQVRWLGMHWAEHRMPTPSSG